MEVNIIKIIILNLIKIYKQEDKNKRYPTKK